MRVLVVLIALLMPLVGLASMAPASAATIVAEYDGEVCHCNALPTEAVSTDTTTLVDFGSPFGAYYLGYSAVLDVLSDGSQSLTINNHTLHYMPTVGAIWAEFLVDNLGDNFIVWHNNLPNLLGILETAVICDVVDPVPGVPEPSTWAMMLIGFAGLRFAFRQSRRKAQGGTTSLVSRSCRDIRGGYHVGRETISI
jgi:PEP-CTERM motif